MRDDQKLKDLRQKVDAADRLILLAIAARISLSKQIRVVKDSMGKAIVDSARESVVLGNIRLISKTMSLPRKPMLRIFREIMSVCLKAQEDE